MILWEQWEATCFENLVDLGIAAQALRILKEVLPQRQVPSDHLAPLPWDSEPVREFIALMNSLNPEIPEEREKGILFLNLFWFRQVILPSLGPVQILDDKSMKESIRLESEQAFLGRISDWLYGISDWLYEISDRLRGIPDSLLDWI
jgi:hypothetical protein